MPKTLHLEHPPLSFMLWNLSESHRKSLIPKSILPKYRKHPMQAVLYKNK